VNPAAVAAAAVGIPFALLIAYALWRTRNLP
jgi:hypothetical protein